jgi:hypothetical protein
MEKGSQADNPDASQDLEVELLLQDFLDNAEAKTRMLG